MKKPLVVFVSPNLYPVLTQRRDLKGAGGAEVQQTEIIKILQELGYPIGVITDDFGQADRENWNGISISKIPSIKKRGMKGTRFIHPRLTDYLPLLNAQDPQIVYTRCAAAQVAVCAYFAKRRARKLIYHAANDLEFQRGPIPGVSAIDTSLFRWGLRNANLIISQNSLQKNALRTCWGRESVVVESSYEDSAAHRGSFEGPILLVGTVKPVKRPELFIELARKLPYRKFKIIGGPVGGENGVSYLRKLKSDASDLSNLEFIGFVPVGDVGKQFDGASILVNTSETEGFPNTFLQAWLRGIPTLSFVEPKDESGRTGTIVAVDLEDMSNKMLALTSDIETWQHGSRAGEDQYLRLHTRQKAKDSYERILDALHDGAVGEQLKNGVGENRKISQ